MIQNHFFLSGFGDCSRGSDNGSNSTAVSDGNAGGTGSCSLRSARLCNDVETIGNTPVAEECDLFSARRCGGLDAQL